MAAQDDDRFVSMNSRNPQMWAAVKGAVDFEGKSVVDLGCGYGDMLLRAHSAGASEVIGIDYDGDIVDIAKARCKGTDIELIEACLFEWLCASEKVYDIMICFSVLPYMDSMVKTLELIQGRSNLALIECQYENDGPGVVVDDEEMRKGLLMFWPKVTKIGESEVKIRATTRSIWLCDVVHRGTLN